MRLQSLIGWSRLGFDTNQCPSITRSGPSKHFRNNESNPTEDFVTLENYRLGSLPFGSYVWDPMRVLQYYLLMMTEGSLDLFLIQYMYYVVARWSLLTTEPNRNHNNALDVGDEKLGSMLFKEVLLCITFLLHYYIYERNMFI